ncbi:MAG: hypothetical protein U1E59_16375 [Amaricoccus sp.]
MSIACSSASVDLALHAGQQRHHRRENRLVHRHLRPLAALDILPRHCRDLPGQRGRMPLEQRRQRHQRLAVCLHRPGSIARFLQPVGQDPERGRQVVGEGQRPGGGEGATDLDRLHDGGERFLAAAELGEAARQVVERAREVGAEGVGAGRCEGAADPDCLLDGERRLAVAEAGAVRQAAERAREVGAEGVGAGGGGEGAVDPNRLLDGGERLLVAAEVGEAVRQVVERAREVEAEGVGAGGGEGAADPDPSADGGARPRGGRGRRRRFDRLLSAPARSGRKASGRTAARVR